VEEWARRLEGERRQGDALRELLAVLRASEERASKLTAVRDAAAAADADAVRIAKENGAPRPPGTRGRHDTDNPEAPPPPSILRAAPALTSLLGRMHPAAALPAEFASSHARARGMAAEDAAAVDAAREKLARITRKLDQGACTVMGEG
jgi:hypothetical protein